MTRLGGEQVHLALRSLASITGSLATYLDRAEHLEAAQHEVVADAGWRLLSLATDIASELGVDPVEAYAARLEQVEKRSPVGPGRVDPVAMVRRAASWRDVQVAQIEHDRWFHADVFGLPRSEQLRHFVLHLAKLTAVLARLDDDAEWFDFVDRRLPDMLLFGVKLATAAGVRLPEASIRDLRVRHLVRSTYE